MAWSLSKCELAPRHRGAWRDTFGTRQGAIWPRLPGGGGVPAASLINRSPPSALTHTTLTPSEDLEQD